MNRWKRQLLLWPLLGLALGSCSPQGDLARSRPTEAFRPLTREVATTSDEYLAGSRSSSTPIDETTTVSIADSGALIHTGPGEPGRIILVEISSHAGAELGLFSTCFPADVCAPGNELEDGQCSPLEYGGEDCLIVSSSDTRHLVHVLQGAVTLAEAHAGIDLAEAATTVAASSR